MIVLEGVGVHHEGADRPVLRDVDLTIPEGDLCLVVGRTGSGKSTLLGTVTGLVPHFTGGTLTGRVLVQGRDTRTTRPRELADVVGYVGQDPLAGFVTDTVEEELAYGMEQLGLAPATMRKRVEETLDLLGIAGLRRRSLTSLSGGQQQRVAIASVMAAHPQVLVLDEPTSALDPTAAQDVLSALTSLVHDTGLTVVLAEHRLERVMHAADTLVWVCGDGGVEAGDPARVLARSDVTPPLAALARAVGWEEVPLSVREARRRARREHLVVHAPPGSAHDPDPAAGDARPPVVSARGLVVRHGAVSALDGVDLDLRAGTVTALMGRNGAGKSSLLWALQGSGRRSAGSVTVRAAGSQAPVDPARLSPTAARRLVSLVPQSAADLLYRDTVADELAQADRETGSPPGSAAAVLAGLGVAIDPGVHPRDLSEGQRLSLVLAVQLVAAPDVVLLDEPTRGLDYAAKDRLAAACRQLAARGAAVLVSTHDVEFAVQVSSRTVVLAEGEVVADGPTRTVCTASPAYAPQVAKVLSPVPVLTAGEVAAGLQERV
ncbi:ABC transporter ATP-binding protein [Ornithinicoccus halotolerans]|uniref:ABC transporter ATP-binding protein n=1 Tax=Ornithinicoccus halotolerans TaxID=1748220 RepID=UPI0012966448|nr:ATP-binding cassette domain-containing protein [Ornithinicoccus halotolerans]